MSEVADKTPDPPVKKPFSEFLSETPPEVSVDVADLAVHNSSNRIWYIGKPSLLLHCEECSGPRWFDCKESTVYPEEDTWKDGILRYVCRNCEKRLKKYALSTRLSRDGSGVVFKYGEIPQFGDPLPSRVFTLIGPDKELFLQGRRAENRGLGIGALTYYRRVVEDQWERIVGEIKKVAERIGADRDVIEALEDVGKHTQFGRSVDSVKPAVPQVLLINGQNPLTLLHSALSEAIHDKSDQQCLEIAQDIRTVLAELAERAGQALKDSVELKQAVGETAITCAEEFPEYRGVFASDEMMSPPNRKRPTMFP